MRRILLSKAKRDIAHTENGFNTGQMFFDQLDALQSLDAELSVVLVAGRQSKGQSIKNQGHRASRPTDHSQVINAPGHSQFFIGGFGHAALVYCQCHGCCTVALDHLGFGQHLIDAVLEVDRVDDWLAGDELERRF